MDKTKLKIAFWGCCIVGYFSGALISLLILAQFCTVTP